MPNHVTNQITFGADNASRAAFQHMLHEMRAEGQPLGSIDFNKLVPMPQELNIEAGSRTDDGLKLYKEFLQESAMISTSTLHASEDVCSVVVTAHLEKWGAKEKADPELWALGEKAYQNIQKYGCPTWYEWCNRNWGTKWNAYNYTPVDKDASTMQFFTAWSSIPQLVSALSRKFPDQEITYRWADEDIGHNVGEMTLKNGDVTDIDIPPDGSRAAYEMAADILGADLADWGLYLTPDKSTYEYRETPPQPPDPAPKKKPRAKGQDR